MAAKNVFWFEELGQKDYELVGKKCANLGELTALHMPVPHGFAITIKAEEAFLAETGILQAIPELVTRCGDLKNLTVQFRLSRDIRDMVESRDIPVILREDILKHYRELSNKCGHGGAAAVSVRSAGSKSHPGQYETVLNVNGEEQLLAMIKKVWSSIFNNNTIAKLVQQGMPIEQSPAIGVGVVQMVNARCAGVGFTVDPISGDDGSVIIESTWGLGEGVVSGKISCDRFVVNKTSLQIVERVLGEKKLQFVIKGNEVVEEEVPLEKQALYTLSDEEAGAIARLGIELEKHFQSPQDFEWAVDAERRFPGNIFLLQTRPVVGVKTEPTKTSEEQLADLLSKLF